MPPLFDPTHSDPATCGTPASRRLSRRRPGAPPGGETPPAQPPRTAAFHPVLSRLNYANAVAGDG